MGTIHSTDVESLNELLVHVETSTRNWPRDGFVRPWFRGHSDSEYPLLPSILRSKNRIHEFKLTKKFRLMAPGYGPTPETSRLDQWLFLMQHHRAPTRLLDWTENPLVAAFFATEKSAQKSQVHHVSIYALDPMALNREAGLPDTDFPVTWAQNPVLQTIKFAFGTQDDLVNGEKIPYLEPPVAIYPSTIHARISSQKGCFTLHGHDERDFESIFAGRPLLTERRLIKYRIPIDKAQHIFRELWSLGITFASLYPDLDGLARELKYGFGIKD